MRLRRNYYCRLSTVNSLLGLGIIVSVSGPEPDLRALPARQSLADQALEALRAAIVTGSLEPGTHLSEVRLSSSLGISRGTLREALGAIVREGLAVSDARGRLRVPDLSARSIRDTFEVRCALEAMAAHLAIARGDVASTVVELQVRLGEMVNSRQCTLLEQVDADMRFHRTLCAASGNATLLESWDALAGRVRMSVLWSGEEKARRNMSPERHQAIIDAVRTADSGVVVTRIYEHFTEAVGSLIGEGVWAAVASRY